MHLNTSEMDHSFFGRKETTETIPLVGDQGTHWAESLKGIYFRIGPGFYMALVVVGSLGVIGNIFTLMVYAKLGFSTTIHISYTALALSDLLSLLTSMLFGYRYLATPLPNHDMEGTEKIIRLLGAYPNFAFTRTTGLFTAWISLERCLCVLFPTRVKVMITRTVTKVAVTSIYIFAALPLVFLYSVYRIEMRVDPRTNLTSVAFLLNKGNAQVKLENAALSVYGLVYPATTCVAVTVCTLALTAKLQQTTKWRSLNAAAGSASCTTTKKETASSGMSSRDVRVTRVVVAVASLFLICSVPTAAQLFAIFTVEGYSDSGHLRYLRSINGMITLLFAQINSSLNIIIFTVSGQRFREALLQILSGQLCKRSR